MIRLAIIGLGAAAVNIHLPAYRRLRDRVRVVAGCDVDAGARARARDAWNLADVFESPEAMIDATAPDVIAVCTPPSFHHDQVLLGLERGCHVFCEKPFAESLDQADRIIDASERLRRTVVVNCQFPAMAIHSAARQVIGSPEFGELLFVHAWQTFRPTEQTEYGWRSELRRRLCFEFGVHVFELMRYFFDATPVSVLAHMPSPASARTPEPVNVVSMEFADGRAASFVLDRLSKGPEEYLTIRLDGELASVQTSIGGELQVSLGLHTRERRPFARVGFAKGGQAVLQDGVRSRVLAREGMAPFAAATAIHFARFLDALGGGSAPAATARDNRDTLALVFAAYDSAERGGAVDTTPYLRRDA